MELLALGKRQHLVHDLVDDKAGKLVAAGDVAVVRVAESMRQAQHGPALAALRRALEQHVGQDGGVVGAAPVEEGQAAEGGDVGLERRPVDVEGVDRMQQVHSEDPTDHAGHLEAHLLGRREVVDDGADRALDVDRHAAERLHRGVLQHHVAHSLGGVAQRALLLQRLRELLGVERVAAAAHVQEFQEVLVEAAAPQHLAQQGVRVLDLEGPELQPLQAIVALHLGLPHHLCDCVHALVFGAKAADPGQPVWTVGGCCVSAAAATAAAAAAKAARRHPPFHPTTPRFGCCCLRTTVGAVQRAAPSSAIPAMLLLLLLLLLLQLQLQLQLHWPLWGQGALHEHFRE